MRCSKCRFENREEAKFCKKCGSELQLTCPSCGSPCEDDDLFCDQCGHALKETQETDGSPLEMEGERKHVTVLFSDLSGYTAMSEKLDPEEIKEITGRIFDEIANTITKYEGFVEKFVGDAVMALFGALKAHEDDPIRAIKAAREIHELVNRKSPEIEKMIGQPISMHTGINTGLVVTGEMDMEKGTHGVAGDAINIASRLVGLAKAGEIVVGGDTYKQAEGHFIFEALKPTVVKGKVAPLKSYRVISERKRPIRIHRLSGLRADLIGRAAELAQLREAVDKLREGKGRIFSICGDAGTGKSRLVEQFKASLDPEEFQWVDGHAYAYSQNIPYFPLIDLLNSVFRIEESDPPAKIREKIESGIAKLTGKTENLVPYIGSLYALRYPEVEEVSPEFWKSRLQKTVQTILSAVTKEAPTIFCLEDLHWADPSFVELLRNLLLQVTHPAIVLCVYRPAFNLFTGHQQAGVARFYREVRLQDLSLSEAQDMLESLLMTDSIPSELRQFVQDKTEGNPFYLEELVNSLIEAKILVRDNGKWKATKPMNEADISASIHGVISSRLDRLEGETKRVLQEASVIGRAFLYEILKRITELKRDCSRCLRDLEHLDLIRTRSFQPDLEYVFKHALTQEIVYDGLLKKERKVIHDRIGLVMEQLFQDRLPEFYETLAFHFNQGESIHKAVDYLMKSGEKSLNRFSLEEAHQYYQRAYELFALGQIRTEAEKELLFDLLEKWALVYYYYGAFQELINLLHPHEALAESLEDKGRRGMFYAWLGMAQWAVGKSRDSYRNLREALRFGEEAADLRVVGYACTWLPNPCVELGLLDEGLGYGRRAKEISQGLSHEQYLYFKSRGDLGLIHYFRGEPGEALEAGKEMIEYGEKHSNIRSQAMGHAVLGWGNLAAGDFQAAIHALRRVEEIAVDPFYSNVWSVFRGFAHLFAGQFQEAESALLRAEKCREAGFRYLEGFLAIGWGLFWINKGKIGKGMNMLLGARQRCLKNEWKCTYAISEYILGKVYLGMMAGEGEVKMSTMLKNLGFLLKAIPFAARRAESHFTQAIAAAQEIGAKGTLASAHLDLGNLHKAKGHNAQAREHMAEAVRLFRQCEAEVFLKQAREALASLK